MNFLDNFQQFCREKLKPSTADSISWIAIVLLHAATIPTLLAVMSGMSDRMPPFDIVLFLWLSLALFFIRSSIMKDTLMMITIGFGFITQAMMLALILFK